MIPTRIFISQWRTSILKNKTIKKLLSQSKYVQFSELIQVAFPSSHKKQKLGGYHGYDFKATKKISTIEEARACITAFQAAFTYNAGENKELLMGVTKIAHFLNELIDDHPTNLRCLVYAWETVVKSLTSKSTLHSTPPGYKNGIPQEMKTKIRSTIDRGIPASMKCSLLPQSNLRIPHNNQYKDNKDLTLNQ
jgi:hypothetical protein